MRRRLLLLYFLSRSYTMFSFFFYTDPAPPESSPLPHPAPLPTCAPQQPPERLEHAPARGRTLRANRLGQGIERNRHQRELAVLARREVDLAAQLVVEVDALVERSEEHTSELQSQSNLVCRLLLDK